MKGSEIPGFGETVATFRTRAELSQQKVASALGMSRRAIAAWEAGDNLPKSKGTVLELARILKLKDEEATTLLKAAGIDPRLPIWNVPYPRNLFFTGRDQELDQLHTQLQQETTAVVGQAQSISGLGGIGKTQLTIEYAYRHHDEYQYILWARAESIEALNTSYSELARLLSLPEKDAGEQEKVTQAVKRWLQRQRSWLLILDNADSPALLSDFLPPTIGGHLLITTRAAEVNTHLSGLAHPLVVDTFSDEQGALFLLHRSGLLALNAILDQVEMQAQQLALRITHELGGLPLALDQAGAYLKATGCSLSTYQQLYQERRAQLLAQRRGADHPEPVTTTWNISFRNVELHNPAAADLLRLCAFLAPDAILEAILAKGAEVLGPVLAPVVADAYLLNEAIEALRTYSLIDRDPHTQTLAVHRLVQAVLRDSMSPEQQQQWMQRAVLALNAALPDIEFENWPTMERLLPHALACYQWIEQGKMTFLEGARLLNQTGNYLEERGRYREAELPYQRALLIREQQFGEMHPDTATCLHNLAQLYWRQGKYEKAELLYQRVLVIYEQQFGQEHPTTADGLNGLAILYRDQERYTEAELLLKRALAIQEQQLGPEHLSTANSMHNLAAVYESLERYELAELLYKRVLAIKEQQISPDHPNTALSLNNLGRLYKDQRKYAEAEPLLKRALAICEQQLGPEHPDTARSQNNLAGLFKSQERYTEAEVLYQYALAVCEQQLDPEHPNTAACLNNLAMLYYEQGKYAEAEPLLQRELVIRERRFGLEHLYTSDTLNYLATVYCKQEKYAEAELLFQRALSIYEQQLGPEHPDTATLLKCVADFYWDQGRHEKAEPLYQRALAIREQVLGSVHPDTAQSLNNLAKLYYAQGRYEKAEPLYQRALAIYEQTLGPQHPTTALILNNLAGLYREQRKYMEAELLSTRALSIYEQTLGPQHPTTALILNNLAELYRLQGKYMEAKPLYRRALAISQQQLGFDHPRTQLVKRNFTAFLRKMKQDRATSS